MYGEVKFFVAQQFYPSRYPQSNKNLKLKRKNTNVLTTTLQPSSLWRRLEHSSCNLSAFSFQFEVFVGLKIQWWDRTFCIFSFLHSMLTTSNKGLAGCSFHGNHPRPFLPIPLPSTKGKQTTHILWGSVGAPTPTDKVATILHKNERTQPFLLRGSR